MERDFLGMSSLSNSKYSGLTLKDEPMDSDQDAGPAAPWPLANKVPGSQQYILQKAVQEIPNEYAFSQFTSPELQPMPNMNTSGTSRGMILEPAPQKCFGLGRQGMYRFSANAPQSQSHGADSFLASSHQLNGARPLPVVSNHSVPVSTSNHYFKTYIGANSSTSSLRQQTFGGGIAVDNPVAGSVVGTLAPRNMPRPSNMTAQLTIFYAGSVSVYDDVPFDKARSIIMMASRGSNAKPSGSRSEAPSPAIAPFSVTVAPADVSMKQTLNPTPIRIVPPCSGLSSPVSVTSHTGANSRSTSSNTDDTAVARALSSFPPTCQQESSRTATSPTAATTTPRAIPQARKASLARFLEKRKERVTDAMPYACPKKEADTDATLEKAKLPSREKLHLLSTPAAGDMNLSSHQESSWRIGRIKIATDSGKSPNTKLEM